MRDCNVRADFVYIKRTKLQLRGFGITAMPANISCCFDLCRDEERIDVALKQNVEAKTSDGDRRVPARGLITTDGWTDGTPAKKAQRTDSQKKEKRQRTLSLKTHKKMAEYHGAESLPLADMEGMLERKHLHQVGGKMATVRSWKHYYTVLAGQLLCFFKDHHGVYKLCCIMHLLL